MRSIILRYLTVALTSCLALSMPIQADAAPERYIVKFKDAAVTDTTRAKRAQRRSGFVGRVGAKAIRNLNRINAVAAELDDDQVARLGRDAAVEFIEPDPKRYLLGQVQPYGIAMVQAPLVADDLAGALTVCIVDSGYSATHEDLSANNVTGTDDPGTGDWDFDGDGHGSHVAGTIAALNNGLGVVGVMPNGYINLHIVKVFGDDGNWAYTSDLVAATEVCQDNGANVINMSLGGARASQSEQTGMQSLYDEGVLLVAAAGNDGNTRHSYPASYDSVISVASIDSNKLKADSSQSTDQVELAAPGVGVLSTVPRNTGLEAGITSLTTSAFGDVNAVAIEYSVEGEVSGSLVNCGLGTSICPSQSSGNICLIKRGDITFAEKAQACQDAGGSAAIIYNNVPGSFSGTLGGPGIAIPVVGIGQAEGVELAQLGGTADLSVQNVPGYAYFDGTSMATPHVVGAAALVWSRFSECTNEEIRDALTTTAEDLGALGRDNDYGFGLVQAKGAVDFLAANGCSGGGNLPPIANAGEDVTVPPRSRIILDGSGSTDPDGFIAQYAWQVIQGRARLRNASTARPLVRLSRVRRDVVIELTVTDDKGAQSTDTMTITVAE